MDKIWFVTGASRGIGRDIARAALAAGDRVVATARDAAHVAAAFPDAGGRVLALALDVTDAAQVAAAVAAAVDHFGRIDVLVNNAGYGQLGYFETVEADAIARQFATNVFGLFDVTRAVLPVMRRQRNGRVFNLSSIGGARGFGGAAIYCAAKFAVEGFSESIAQEVQPFGIRVTIVEPGFFRTDFLDPRSVAYGTRAVEDYAAVAAEHRATYDGYSHQQAGDPAKLGRALVALVAADDPPLHFAAGTDAVGVVADALDVRRADLERWRDLSISTDGEVAAEVAAAA